MGKGSFVNKTFSLNDGKENDTKKEQKKNSLTELLVVD